MTLKSFICFAALVAGLSPFSADTRIEGIWKVVAVTTIKSDGQRSTILPTESQVIFADGHYSFCWTSHRTPHREWIVPDSMKVSRYNQTIVNAGAYKLEDSVLISSATFALNPMFVDGVARFRISFAGDSLVLSGIEVFSKDKIPHPVYANGSRIVTKLVRLR